MKKASTLVLSIFITGFQLCHSQNEVATIDSLTGFTNKDYPFDKAFPVRFFPRNKPKIRSVSLFELDKNGCLKPYTCIICPKRKRPKNWDDGLLEGEFASYEITFIQSQNLAQIDFNLPPLKPNTSYLITISSIQKVSEIYEVLDALTTDPSDRNQKAAVLYDNIARKYKYIYNNACACCKKPIEFEIATFPQFLEWYRNNGIKVLVDSFYHYKAELKLKQNESLMFKTPEINLDPFKDTFFKELFLASENCITCKDTLWRQQIIMDPGKMVSLIIVNLQKLSGEDVSQGWIDIEGAMNYRRNPNTSHVKRQENLLKTINALKQLAGLTEYYRYTKSVQDSDATAFLEMLASAITNLQDNLVVLKLYNEQMEGLNSGLSKQKNKLDDLFNAYDGFTTPISNLNPNTYTYNFETRSGFALKADFGFLYYGNPWSNKSFHGFSPFVGFHVNFRPLNTDIPYPMIPNKGILGHLSFNAGVILVSLEQDQKRAGLMGKTSIFTGFGWAFGHSVRLISGAIWFRKEDINPLIDNKTTAATPYIGLSIDLRLKDIYNSFKKIFE